MSGKKAKEAIRPWLKPLGERVLLQPLDPDYKSPGGLYLPEAFVTEPTYRGTIIKTGPDCKWSQVGQDVFYVRHCGNEIIFGGRNYVIVKEVDLIACVNIGEELPF